MSAAFTVNATMPAAFIPAVGARRTAVNLAGGYSLATRVRAGPEPPPPPSPWHPLQPLESKIALPWADVVASPAEFPAATFEGSRAAAGSAFAGAGEGATAEAGGEAADATFDVSTGAAGAAFAGPGAVDPEAFGLAAAVDVPPRPVTYETRAFISAAFTVKATMPAAFIPAVGAFRTAVNLAGGYRLEISVNAGPEPPPPRSPWHPAQP